MKTHIRRQQQDTKQKEPPQKYRLGTIFNTKLLAGLNRFYMAITSHSASAVVQSFDPLKFDPLEAVKMFKGSRIGHEFTYILTNEGCLPAILLIPQP